jgi:hypothetical protein
MIQLVKIPLAVLRVLVALLAFVVSGRTPFYPYLGMRRLHVATRGGSTRLLARLLSKHSNDAGPEAGEGVLGRLEQTDVSWLAQQIRQDGFVVFDALLPDDLCDALEAFARSTPARPTPPVPGRELLTYDKAEPLATRYNFDEADLLSNPSVQRVACDPTLRLVAGAYLQAVPVNDMVSMWWTIAHGEVSSEAAQMFHYDLDRTRFLKFFIYLTDVTSGTGPHVFVQGSHLRRPDPFYEDRRFSDDEVAAAYPAERVCELGGRRGTIMAVDTSGIHKGKHPQTGHRLVLQVEYSVSLFGTTYERLPDVQLVPEAAAEVARAPLSFRRFSATG